MPTTTSSELTMWRTLFTNISIIAVLLVSGCSQQLQRQTCVLLTPQVNYCLAPLMTLSDQELAPQNSQQQLTQKISFTHGDKHHELLTQLELSPEMMTMVGLAPLGQALFTVTYDGETVVSQQNVLMGDDFKAEYLMAIMQLIYRPHQQVNPYFSQGQMQDVACEADNYSDKNRDDNRDNGKCSALIVDNEAAIQISYSDLNPWIAEVILRFPAANITLSISPL
ncbi:DUF3261 domain-containing protein [Pseudomonadota bacterium]